MVVFITGLEKEFDRALAAVFAEKGYKVYAIGSDSPNGVTLLPSDVTEAAAIIEKETGLVDIYIDVSNERSSYDTFTVRSGLNAEVIRELHEKNVVRPMAKFEIFLPLLEKGEGRRLCFLSSAKASINETYAADEYGYRMAKVSLHNFIQITRNVLAPKGYSFRVFDPLYQDVSPELAAQAALNYFTRRRATERNDDLRDDEGNIVLRDANGRHHSW